VDELMAADDEPFAQSDDPVINEALSRFNRASEWEATFRPKFIEDLKFRHGDSDNGYQWPNAIRRARDEGVRPCLTMNLIRQHNLQIVNESKQNKKEIKVLGLGNGATAESATVVRALIRHIFYQSEAQSAFSLAQEFQVDGGIGWWRLVTDYAGPDTFDQEIFVLPVLDPLSVLMDPDIRQKNGSDASWSFVFDDVPKDEFENAYPKYSGMAGLQPLGVGTTDNGWLTDKHVRVCEYFRMVPHKFKLISFMDKATGVRKNVRDYQLPEEARESVLTEPTTRTRPVEAPVCEWKLIAGMEVIDETIWAGKYIPLVRVVGEEITLGGTLDRKGHTRAMKDAQRMFNYNASGQVEFVALQSKTPWVAPAKAIEEHETQWNNANTQNAAVLLYNHVDADNPDVPVPPPSRTEPPTASPAFQSGMDTAQQQMMMTSGQFQNQLGMNGNERTGKAIQERQGQSDTATFHFRDNYEDSLRFTGKLIIDLLPKVYDTKRVKRVLADDGAEMAVELDPGARQAYQEQLDKDQKVIRRIFNPHLGEYDIAAEIGPAYASKRQETVEALTLILTQAPALTGIIGDLLMSSMDFDKASEAAQRLKNMVPPQALGKGPSQAEQVLQTQVQSLSQALQKLLERNAKDGLKLVGKDEMRDIDIYKAVTERLKVEADHGIASRELEQDLHSVHLEALTAANAQAIDASKIASDAEGDGAKPSPSPAPAAPVAPVPGARQAPDGEWYLADPTRMGKYMRVAPLAQERNPRSIISNA